ncbi:MAG: ABC transporter permease [Solirubrobacterales bacterium]|nr:ABC transporter permease [Solirubrobacterales bacterium]
MSVGAPELLIEAESAAEAAIGSAAAEIEARSPLELFWRRFRADRVAVVSLGVILALILVAIIAPLIVTLVGAPGPNTQNTGALDQFGTPTGPSKNALWPFIVVLAGVVLAIAASALPGPRLRRRVRLALAVLAALLAIVLAAAFWPGAKHLFGVDPLGRDVFARVLYGARVSLLVAFVATGISMVVGVTLGMVAGYFRGAVDMAISRLIDVLLAFPILMLALGVAAACSLGHGCLGGVLKPGLVVVIFVIAFVNWTYIARIVRGQVLSLREKEFVEASRSLGASNLRIIFKEILPNLVAPIIVYATLIIPQNILFEAALSFLGAGVQPPTASWGAMLADATSSFNTAWWYMVFPGAALLITVLAFNLVGDGLQDALHPKAASS